MSTLEINRPGIVGLTWTAACLAFFTAVNLATHSAHAQPRSPVHYPYRSDQPPGTIGISQLQRGGPVHGYFQPVELYCPSGARIGLEIEGQFESPETSRVRAGMLIGPVYRAKVTDIPKHAGAEVYPTVEVINRLFPPPGHEARFPIPIHITQEEMELALEGNLVTRVVYLEDPATALPIRERATFQRYYEVHPRQDPLQVADELGRPMAILRMGSRLPDASGQMGMNYGSPPLVRYELPEDLPVEEPQAVPPVGEGVAPATTTSAVESSSSTAEHSVLGTSGRASLVVPPAQSVLRSRGSAAGATTAARPRADGSMPGFVRDLFHSRGPK